MMPLILSAAHLQRREACSIGLCSGAEDEAHRSRDLCSGNVDDLDVSNCRSCSTTIYPHNKTARKSRKRRKMPTVGSFKPPTWISAWFLLTAPIVLWDVGYCFMRPRSFEGGDLHWIWEPYSIYQNIDHVYSVDAYENKEGFANAQSTMNTLETLLNLTYLYLAHVMQWPAAPLIGFTAAVMTLAKTMLYMLNEHFCDYCSLGRISLKEVIVYWILPNGFWIVLPSLIVFSLGKDLCARISAADAKVKKT